MKEYQKKIVEFLESDKQVNFGAGKRNKTYRVIEIRKTEKWEEFAVETVYNAESMAHLKKWLDENPSKVQDKNYRIKEIN